MTNGALQNLKILDLTQVMAGPFCTMLLADLGAEVIKIEPEGGDQTRHAWGRKGAGSDGPAFFALNRNKKSVVLDLKAESDKKQFLELVKTADVVIENYRPGVMKRLGLSYDSLRSINPGIIYASVSGFGQTGPYADRPGYDLIAQGMAGTMGITGLPNSDPVKAGVPVADLSAGFYCAYGILAAYIHKESTGEGQYLETSLFESAMSLSVWEAAEYWASEKVPVATGSSHRLSAPYQAVRASDGWLTIGANNQRLWGFLCAALDRQDLEDDERFSTNIDRMNNRNELIDVIENELKNEPVAVWVDRLLQSGVPAGPIHSYDEVLADPHARERDMVLKIEHPVEGHVNTLGFPVKFNKTPAKVLRHPPLLGEHNELFIRSREDR